MSGLDDITLTADQAEGLRGYLRRAREHRDGPPATYQRAYEELWMLAGALGYLLDFREDDEHDELGPITRNSG